MNISSRNGNGTTQACAACKYQRRKCAPDCILAPYFPHDRQRQFMNAHKLFGVSNITKIIKPLDTHDKDQAMRTIIYQSDMRANDPVGGCYRYIQDLQAQIDYCRAELDLVLQQLAFFRAQAHHQHQQQAQAQALPHVYNATATGCPDAVLNADPLNLYAAAAAAPHYHYLQQVPPQQAQYIVVQENSNNNSNSSNPTTPPLQEDVNSWTMKNSMSSLSSLSLQGSGANVGDEFDQKPMIEIPSDERNIELRFESEDQFVDRSDEAVLFKIENAVVIAEADCIHHAQDHDLKGAATLFTLTNCTG